MESSSDSLEISRELMLCYELHDRKKESELSNENYSEKGKEEMKERREREGRKNRKQ